MNSIDRRTRRVQLLFVHQTTAQRQGTLPGLPLTLRDFHRAELPLRYSDVPVLISRGVEHAASASCSHTASRPPSRSTNTPVGLTTSAPDLDPANLLLRRMPEVVRARREKS